MQEAGKERSAVSTQEDEAPTPWALALVGQWAVAGSMESHMCIPALHLPPLCRVTLSKSYPSGSIHRLLLLENGGEETLP